MEWLGRIASDGKRTVKKLPETRVVGRRKGRHILSWMIYVDLNLRNMNVKIRIERASSRRE